MWGQAAKELLEDLKKSQWMPQFDSKLVRECQKEICDLEQNVAQTLQIVGDQKHDPYYSSGINLHHAAAQHINLCVNAYCLHRMRNLELLWWEKGTLINTKEKGQCCEQEVDYLRKYDSLMNDYMKILSYL
eukprot:UN08745